MNQNSSNTAHLTPAELSDPNIDAATLRDLSIQRPDLWPHILQHPNCYESLADYIRQRMAQAPQDQAGGAPQTQPTASTPAAGTRRGWQFWVSLGQPVLALIAFITLFTPAVRVLDEYDLEGQAERLAEQLGLSDELSAARDELGLHTTQNFITHDLTAVGVILLLLLVATVAAAAVSLVGNKTLFSLAAGGVGAVTGLMGIIVSIIYLVAAGEDHLTVGFGAVLMLILCILLIAVSAVAALPRKSRRVAQP